MHRLWNRIWDAMIIIFTILSLLVLGFVLFFIVKEALPLFSEVSVLSFLTGTRWMPVAYTGEPSFGIFYFILSTIFVSLFGLLFACVLGLGAAVFLSCMAPEALRETLYPIIDLLAGIPSVIYGFVGLNVIVKYFFKIGIHTGSCILAASLLLGVMLLPYLISGFSDTIIKVNTKYLVSIENLGISKWYGIMTMILPISLKRCLGVLLLAAGRAMGETMAVMMVIGNANVFPTLLGKGESIAAVIALEMGTAVADSTHYHALYAAGLVLLVMMLLLQWITAILEKKLLKWEE